MSAPAFLSKTRVLSGAQCARRLWLEKHRPDLLVVDADTRRNFERGHDVGAVARTLWPDGVLIASAGRLADALRETAARLAEPGPLALFEATFSVNGVLVRVDVLERDDAGQCRLVEVKASTSVKPEHLLDCAVQLGVLRGAGLPVGRVELAHVDSSFTYPGGGDYRGLLHFADVTERVEEQLPRVPPLIARLRAALAGPEPDIAIGPHCRTPYECPFLAHCAPPPVEFPVERLPGNGRALPELAGRGIRDIRDVPPGLLTNEVQEWVRRVTVAGVPELRPGAAAALRGLGWPRRYLDFETVGCAVPVWAGTRPYQPIPFQWSCHVEEAHGALEQHAFLADGDGPPQRAFLDSLLAQLGDEGPVFVYTDYERRILNDLARAFPERGAALDAVVARLVDLYPLTKAHYYHPRMLGSWSLKAVLPAIAPDLGYDRLDIHDGGEAEAAFRTLLDPALPDGTRSNRREALLAYCALDTLALVRLARHLEGRA